MLFFTPDVTEALEWFQLLYQLNGGYGWLAWHRAGLPAAGGVEDQPAKLMEALALIAREENTLLRRAAKKRPGAERGDDDAGADKPKRRRGRRG